MKTTSLSRSHRLWKPALAALVALTVARLSSNAQIYTMDEYNAVGVYFDQEYNRIYEGYMLFYGPGSFTATLNMPAGKYKVSADRNTKEGPNFSFHLSVNDVHRLEDYATHPAGGSDEQWLTIDYLGYVITDGSPVTVLLDYAGVHGGRVESISFTPTDDIYFDENTPDLIVSNVSDLGLETPVTPYGFTTTLKNGDGVNGKEIKTDGGSMSGTVTLEVGQSYAVYASREVHTTHPTQLSYDVALDFNYFATVSGLAVNVVDDGVEEIYLGQFTPSTALTNVLLYNAGQYSGRHDYLRFAAIPEPSSIALLLVAGFGGLFFWKRSAAKVVV